MGESDIAVDINKLVLGRKLEAQLREKTNEFYS